MTNINVQIHSNLIRLSTIFQQKNLFKFFKAYLLRFFQMFQTVLLACVGPCRSDHFVFFTVDSPKGHVCGYSGKCCGNKQWSRKKSKVWLQKKPVGMTPWGVQYCLVRRFGLISGICLQLRQSAWSQARPLWRSKVWLQKKPVGMTPRGTKEEYCSLVSRFGLISRVHPQLR